MKINNLTKEELISVLQVYLEMTIDNIDVCDEEDRVYNEELAARIAAEIDGLELA